MNTFNKILPLTLSLVYLLLMSIIAFGQTTSTPSSTINIDTLFSKVQVSYLPFLSTSGYKCKDATVDYSLNLVGGYVKGVRKLEVGGTFNIDREDVKSCQLAGCLNFVGGNMQGMQAAGLINCAKTSTGLQIAGWGNFTQKTNGAQIAGLTNLTLKGNCTQIGGLLNSSMDTTPVQISGLVNQTVESNGIQLAGLANVAFKKSNTQIAGLVNISEISTVQIAGVVNYSKYISGLQLGLINVSDSCTGTPIGLLSFTKNGYHKLEIGSDEIFYTSIAYRGGVKQFHNIFTAAIEPENYEKPLWAYGYGIGTSFGNPKKILLDIDLTARHVMQKGTWYERNDIYSLGIGFDKHLFSKVSLAASVTYNIYLTDTKYAAYQSTFAELTPYHLTDHTYSNGTNMKTWIGGKIALRFF